MDVRFLMGNEAIGRGVIEAGCGVATAYPGTPSSEIMESLVRWKKELDHSIYLEWSVNEKVAFETAYGASLAGARSAVTMKMVGLNVASDPFTSAAYLGVRGGMVIIVADDPGPHSSQTEQDSRFFSWFAKVPCLDPGTPREALAMTHRAFELSEKYHVPVMLRPCLRVCHARQNVSMGTPSDIKTVGPFEKNWTRWAAIPKFRLVLHGELNQKLKELRKEPEAAPKIFGAHEGPAKLAVVTSGSVSSHVKDVVAADNRLAGTAIFKVDMPYPADGAALDRIVESHEKTLVIEETYPVLELQMQDRRRVLGRMSGHVPAQGELLPETVESLISRALDLPPLGGAAPDVKPRRPSLCAGCPHRPAFHLIRQVFEGAVYTGDIGCYTLGINMGAVDTCLCMGASISMAAGFARVPLQAERPRVVATIGDSTFFHAGVPALINAVHTRASLTLVILDNNITAMTGGQPTPAVAALADGARGRAVSIETLVRGCGVEFLEVVDPYNYLETRESFERARAYSFEGEGGVSVVIARRPCVRTPGVVIASSGYRINESCDLCMTCVRDLECPAFRYVKGERRMEIDRDVCANCGFCVSVCPSGAIEAVG